jgi:NADH dehydrogenase
MAMIERKGELARGSAGFTPRAVIYQPSRSAMMSGGKAAARHWVLEFDQRSPSVPDPLMGWSSSKDTMTQLRLEFASREAALAYARRNGFEVAVIEPNRAKPPSRSYAANFLGGGGAGVSGYRIAPDRP